MPWVSFPWVSFGAFPLMWGMIFGVGLLVDGHVSPLRYGGVSRAIGFAPYVLLYLLPGCTLH